MLAADSRVTVHGGRARKHASARIAIAPGDYPKIYVCRNGVSIGYAGSSHGFAALRNWVKAGADRSRPPNLPLDADAIVALPDGRVFGLDGKDFVRVRPPFAIGTGADAALAAMRAGADARRAVQIAATIDPCTGGRIRTRLTGAKKPVSVVEP